MAMNPRRLLRRTLLRGAGSVAIALPWLEAMGPPARAAAAPARRFVGVFQPGGTVRARYTPSGSEAAFTLGPICKPLEALQSRILLIDGLAMQSAIGEQHQAGIVALLTGTPQGNDGYATGPSLDQVLARRLVGQRPRASLQLAVRWATGKAKGRLHPINSLNFEDAPGFAPIPPRLDPAQIFGELFGRGPGGIVARGQRQRSILDHVDRRYQTLAARLGGDDRRRLEQHLTKLRELEVSLGAPGMSTTTRGCRAPAMVDTTGYNPRTGLSADDLGEEVDAGTDAAIPKVGKFMIDMLVMALACDLTAVATLQWSDTEAKHTFPWLGLRDHHHYYQHDGGFRPRECEAIATWYAEQHAYLLQQMAAIELGDRSLLDESVVFFGSELQDPPSHGKTNMPFLLAGGGGGLRGGRWLVERERSHNDLLVAILNLFGDPRSSFGDGRYCAGALPGLTSDQ